MYRFLILMTSIGYAMSTIKTWTEQEETAAYWNGQAQNALMEALRLRINDNVAKNIIFFMGDGMGISTVTAARVLKGQKQGRTGEESVLEFEKFPHVALIKTYNVNKQVPDSAGTATAYLCGVKSHYEVLGLTAKAIPRNCTSGLGQEISSILQWAQESGKDTGLVTTTRVTHASPAGLYAHSASRDWEADSLTPPEATACKDIALQLVEDTPGNNIKVIMAGGRGYLTPLEQTDPLTGQNGLRTDKRNLINEWLHDKRNRKFNAKYVTNNMEFNRWNPNETDYILGLFDYGHMSYEMERDHSESGQPSLTEMTTKAINMLSRNTNGYFLFVEGGRIDHAHHDEYAQLALEDTLAFEDAILAAIGLTNEDDTTILVTADHSHVFTINGHQPRGNPILGVAGISDVDNMTFTTLMYTNGPGYMHPRANITNEDTTAERYRPQAAVPMTQETHGGEDVAAYARGPMAHLFHGVQEQNYIAHALAYAACIGSNKGHCKDKYVINNKFETDVEPNPKEQDKSFSSGSTELHFGNIPLMTSLFIGACSLTIIRS